MTKTQDNPTTMKGIQQIKLLSFQPQLGKQERRREESPNYGRLLPIKRHWPKKPTMKGLKANTGFHNHKGIPPSTA